MPKSDRTMLRHLQKRGSGLCVVLPKHYIDRLGWCRDDALRLDIVQGVLVVCKVDLPVIPDLQSVVQSAQPKRKEDVNV
jgi:antitoxin component of MazEF toxin-antitoxin module